VFPISHVLLCHFVRGHSNARETLLILIEVKHFAHTLERRVVRDGRRQELFLFFNERQFRADGRLGRYPASTVRTLFAR
jgi:hypothetical protein